MKINMGESKMAFKFDYKEPKIIAEIGCNHMGQFEIAKELIDLAQQSGAKYVKFQKRNNKELLTEDQYNAPHPVPENSYGDTYGTHREFLEFNVAQNRELKEYCDSVGMVYSTSVWDVTSAKEMITFEPEFLKIPSACNNNFEMLKVLRDDFKGQVQLSIGMTSKDEVEEIVKFFEETNQAKSRLLIYSCTSGYPVPACDVALLEINWLYEKYENRVNEIGFSGHHLGTNLDIAAYTLGARWIERHFTKDKNWKGTDHGASLEPYELKNLVDGLNETFEALHYKKDEANNITLEKATKDINRLLNNRRNNSKFDDNVGYLIKTEYGEDRNVHFHTFFFYDGQKVQKDMIKGEDIGKYWSENVTSGKGTYYSCNRNDYKDNQAIGMLDYRDTEKRRNLVMLCRPYSL